MRLPNKIERGSIRTTAYDLAVQKWWWSFSIGARVILANMAGITLNGKCICNYEDIKYNGNVSFVCYDKLA